MPVPKSAEDKDYGRPLSIEDVTNTYFVHPLSAFIVNIALPLKVSANIVSLLGLASGWLAAWFYLHQSSSLAVLIAFSSMVAWHIFDGADGKIARATNTASPFGRILDGICDHLVFGAVYIAFVLYILASGGSNFVWGLALLAALSHTVQSAAYEERRQIFQRRTRGLGREDILEDLLNIDGKKSVLAGIYDKFQRISSPRSSDFDIYLKTMRAENMPQGQVQEIINKTVKIVKAWGLLNANNRTIMLAVTAMIGQPLWFFIYEITVLNVVFIGLLFYERNAETEILTGTSIKT